MIISVYIWAQLTSWDNPSHRPQGMVGMSKVFTSWSSVCTHEHNLQSEWIRVTVHRAWLEWARFSHYDHQCVHMGATYLLSESESPSTVHGWNEQGFHIMIISVYIWAQLTSWVNPSHRPQGMVGMIEFFTSWSSVCTYEHNLLAEIIQVTVHRAWLNGMSKVFTSWSSVCTYE